ncbi:hypothetical protein GFS24_18995 [Chitinophaga sp. SYP-B3965]|uniref:nucleotidyl transferase AbiEii/AbiGii toxin family protein n=1 Tax=Chitinophaga sp. SYP-B3965 TaxID=2663120 RepID=UPI00129A0ADF|nr:nucleotidyl transferase AbiEii/AbiGii toxin family protein [Chitinophaga sp. SYP-B3965]MRG47216.1 hypothetical protein [Chitinophaga sp. SYP-B3965]
MHENIVRIKAVANLLKGIGQPYVFVGGATVSLYNTAPAVAKAIRPTEDVDVVIELISYKDYAEIDARLRAMGFVNDITSGVICRYRIQGMIVDIMPTEPVMGFSNRWYPEGFRHAITHNLDAETKVLIFSLPYFLASKWEAHRARGGKDLRASKDFEDMVYIFENCNDFDQQLLNGPEHVRNYLQKEFSGMIDHPDFEEAVSGHMEDADNTGVILQLKSALSLN